MSDKKIAISSFFAPKRAIQSSNKGDDVTAKKTKIDKSSSSSSSAPSSNLADVSSLSSSSTSKSSFKTSTNSSSSSSSTSKTTTNSSSTDLSTHLTDPTWTKTLSSTLTSPSFLRLTTFVATERTSCPNKIYPPPNEVFSAFNLTPYSNIKVVIIGQDPYHGSGQGHGLAFSVKKGIAIPPSLRNIYKEALSDGVMKSKPSHGNLEHWAKQGVFMLNSVMTVREGEANSHQKKGWEDFTDSVVRTLNSDKKDLVFLLWGKPAHDKAKNVNQTKHRVICSSHPSPLGATKTSAPFIGSKCFSRCNEALKSEGIEEIDWEIPA